MQTQKISSRAAAEHSAAAFRSWADQSGISLADANVVMSVMGSLNKIIESAMDGGGGLEDIPVEDHVKRTILDLGTMAVVVGCCRTVAMVLGMWM